MAPLKRHPALIPLSKDHHFGLLLCWKIRQGITKEIPLSRIINYVCWFYENHLKPHFDLEEKFIFPLLNEDHPLREEAMNQHRQLRGMVKEFNQSQQTEEPALLELEKLLEKHIRMEERELFQEIQKKTGEEKLIELEKMVNNAHQKSPDDWDDPFWLGNKP